MDNCQQQLESNTYRLKYLNENYAFNRKIGKNCDVCIVVDGMKIPAHKKVLSKASPYFKNMFNIDMMEANRKEVSISGIDHHTIELVIEDMYGDRAKITEDNAQSILMAANYMQISDLVDRCGEFMIKQVDQSNCIPMRNLLNSTVCDKRLVDIITGYINAYFVPLSKHESFVQLDIDDVTQLLSSDNLYIDNEIDVYQAAIRWLDGKKERKEYVDRVLKCIRSSLISPSDLSSIKTHEKKLKHGLITIIHRSLSSIASLLSSKSRKRDERLTDYAKMLSNLKTEKESARKCPDMPSRLVQLLYRGKGDVSILKGYDPSTKQWNILKNFDIFPFSFYIVCDQWRIYLFDSIFTQNGLSCFGRLDYDTGIYTSLTSSGSPISENDSSAVIVGDKLYVMNFYQGNRPFMEIYDIETDMWSSGPATNLERQHFPIAAIGKYIYVCGGIIAGQCLRSVERFDTVSMKWDYVAPMIHVGKSTSAVAFRGKLYVAGRDNYRNGSYFQVYDPITDQWTKLTAISDHYSDTVLVATFDNIYAMRKCVGKIECYDVVKDEWMMEAISTTQPCQRLPNERISTVFTLPISLTE